MPAQGTTARWETGWGSDYYYYSGNMSSGTEIRIRVVDCPGADGISNAIVLWKTALKPNVEGIKYTQLARWDNITHGQVMRYKLNENWFLSISTAPIAFANCAGLTTTGDFDTMTFRQGNRFWKLDVKIVNEF